MNKITSNKLAFNILQLQNLIKRDPPSYYDEFYVQHQHFQSLLELFKLNPQEYNETVSQLVMFLAQVSPHYKADLEAFPGELMTLLRNSASVLDASMRMCFCKALIMMRNKDVIPPLELITLCFELLRCKDKILRSYLQVHIVSDVKNSNVKHKNTKLNSVLQNFMFKMLADRNATAAKVSLDIMVDLYRRNVWKDVKTVNAIATACFSRVNKVLVTALHFFLGVDEEEDKDSDSEDDTPTVKEVMMANRVNKQSRKRMKVLKRTKQVLKKSKKKKKDTFDFSAIHLLHDPQGMAEKLLKNVQTMNERFEIKLLIMNVISRLIGVHELILLNYYPLLIRYLMPHQRDVTQILMFAAQAAHENLPPDVMEPVVRQIANNFITERNSAEAITVGLNATREICFRCPLAISQDLLQDLVQYQKFKNKNVQMAAKSIIQLFRKISPQMLQRKYRTKPTEQMKELTALEYGALKAKSYIPGSELLSLEPSNDDTVDNGDEDEANNSDGSWIDVSHSEDELSRTEEKEDDDAHDNKSVDYGTATEKNKNKTPVDSIEDDPKSSKKNQNEEADTSSSNTAKTEIENKEKAMTISQSRILSQEEFHKLKVAQVAKHVQFAKGKKRTAESILDEPDREKSELVSLKDIEKLHKRPKLNKETRLATLQEEREGKEKFGKKKPKSQYASKTQKEHNKNKAFMMIKHKVRAKTKRSFKDKQIALRNALLKCKKRK